MDMVSEGFVGTLKKSLTEGKITMKTLDAACRRILEAKYKLGLFDDPYKYCDLSRPARDIFTREHRAAARRIAAESFVLLKNEPFEGQGKKSSRPVLPLEKQGTVAVIGPLGNTRSNMPRYLECCRTPGRLSLSVRRIEGDDSQPGEHHLRQR